MLLTEVQLCCWVGGKWHHTTFLSLKMGVHTCHCSGSSHWRANNLPACVSGFCQVPALTISVPRPLACPGPEFYCVLSLTSGWGSKLQILKSHMAWTHSPPLEESLATLWLVPFFSQESNCTAAQLLEVYGEAHQKPTTRLSAVCACFCPLQVNRLSMMTAASFVLGKAIYPLPNIIQEGEHSLPACPRGSLQHAVHCQPGTLPYAHQAQLWGMVQTWAPLLVKKTCESSFDSPVSGFVEVFFLHEPNVLLSLSLSFSFLIPQKAFTPPLWHRGFALPQFTASQLRPVMFFPSNCADCSFNLQIIS